MSKRKILLLAVTVCLMAVLLAGGTLAYFTDTDSAKNVLTAGNVSIRQDETDRNGKPLRDELLLFPVTGEDTEDTPYGTLRLAEQNYIDKIVTVTNDGRGDAYVRTLFAFQMPKTADGLLDPFSMLYIAHTDGMDGKGIEWVANTADGIDLSKLYADGIDRTYVELDGRTYCVGVFYYGTDSHLVKGETTEPSLLQVALKGDMTNAEAALFNDYNLLVLTQASQTPGFTDAKTALDTAFGAVETATAQQLQAWFAEVK